MNWRNVLLVGSFSALLVSCGTHQPSGTLPNDGPHAKLTLKDGSSLSGKVLQSTPTEITLAGDDNQNHTVSTSQVRSLEYEDAAGTSPAPVANNAQPNTQPKTFQPTAPQTVVNAPPVVVGPAPAAQKRPAPAVASDPNRAFGSSDAADEHYHPTESAIRSRTLLLASGTSVPVRTEETIDSSKAVEGQTFAAEITRDISDAEGAVVIPRNSNAQIVIRSAAKGGRFKGQSDLALDLSSISVGGRRYQVSTADIVEKGKPGIGANKRTGVFTGGGSAFGAIIGAIAGGGKGAAIGALSGAAAGAGTQVLTKGGAVKVPVESVLTFRLDRPLRITVSR